MKRGVESPVRRRLGAALLRRCCSRPAAAGAEAAAAADRRRPATGRPRSPRRRPPTRPRTAPARSTPRPPPTPTAMPLTFSLSGGADRAAFAITAGRRALLRRSRPISRRPTDADAEQCLSGPDRGQRRHDQRRRSTSPSPSPMSGPTASASRRVGTGFSQPLYLDRRARRHRAGCSSSSRAG